MRISLAQEFRLQTAISQKQKMIKIIRRCQNSRLVKGCYLLFHESVVTTLFAIFGLYGSVFGHFMGVRGGA